MNTEQKKVGAGFGILIIRDGKVLLGKRHEDTEKADSELCGEGTWTMPGGKLEFGESFEDGAARELKEETGMKLNAFEVMCVSNDMVPDAHFVTVGLRATDVKGEPEVREPDEITEWRWFSLDDLPTPLFFPSARILACYQEKTFYKSSHK